MPGRFVRRTPNSITKTCRMLERTRILFYRDIRNSERRTEAIRKSIRSRRMQQTKSFSCSQCAPEMFKNSSRRKTSCDNKHSAAVGCLTCFIAKIIGAKIVWIDSVTNVERLSLSGRLVRGIANLFLVQWPNLERNYKKVEYVGAI